MRKTGFWKTDWFLGVVVSVAMLAAGGSDLIRSLERKAYDMGVQASSRMPLDRVAVVAIDDTSIANLGRWPWPRDRLAKMTDLLAGGKAKVIANTVFFFEPQIDPGYHYVTKLLELHQQHPEKAPRNRKSASCSPKPKWRSILTASWPTACRMPGMFCCRCCLRWASRVAARTRICPNSS